MASPFVKVSGRRGGGPGRVQHRRVELRPVGTDGTAVVTQSLYTGPARVTHIKVDYISQPATTDLVIKANGSSGATLFTNSNANTDIAIRTVGSPAASDEARNVTAATDGVEGGWFVSAGLYFDVAQGDTQTTGDEAIIIDVWYEELELLKVSLYPAGADGSAAATRLVKMHTAGVVLGVAVDFGAGVPNTTDLTITSDVIDAGTGGDLIFTSGNSATDVSGATSAVALGIVGIDETNAAVAATDGVSGGAPFRKNLYFAVAEADGYAADEDIQVYLYCRV